MELKLFTQEGKPVTVNWSPQGFLLTTELTIPLPAKLGKAKRGNRPGSHRNGDGGWKLTAHAVRRIRKASARTKNPRGFYVRMASRYNVTPTAIWAVVKGRTWKGV